MRHTSKMYAAVLISAVLGLIGIWDGSAGAREFRFAVLGDNRSTAPVVQPLPFKWAIEELNLLNPDFVVIVGDLIRGYTSDNELLKKEWDEFDRVVATFRMPFHLVVGNHDVWDENSEQVFKDRYGKLYYSFDHKGSHFIVLDSDLTSCFQKIDEAQLDWLKGDLEAHKDAEHIFVFLHKPLWLKGDPKEDREGFPEEIADHWNQVVHPLLARYNVDAVIAGHFHYFRNDGVRDGIRYLITGGAGAPLRGERADGGYYHWIRVDVKPEQVIFTVMPTGAIMAEADITPETLAKGGFLREKKNVIIEFLRPPDHIKFVPKHICRAVQELKIDGDLKDWTGLEPLSLDQASQVFFYGKGSPWKGPEDLSAKIFTAWDKNSFYLAAIVKDNMAGSRYQSELMFKGDCIQVAFDPLDKNSQTFAGSDVDVREFGFALAEEGPAVFCYRSPTGSGIVKDATVSIRYNQQNHCWYYEVALPWGILAPLDPEHLPSCGFNVIVNDNDGQGRKGWIQWTPGLGESKDASWYGDLIFEK